jgi:hypothetical protein
MTIFNNCKSSAKVRGNTDMSHQYHDVYDDLTFKLMVHLLFRLPKTAVLIYKGYSYILHFYLRQYMLLICENNYLTTCYVSTLNMEDTEYNFNACNFRFVSFHNTA